jgi:hypothetical protein
MLQMTVDGGQVAVMLVKVCFQTTMLNSFSKYTCCQNSVEAFDLVIELFSVLLMSITIFAYA